MIIYLAGKITGDPDYKSKFAKHEEFFTNAGDIVLNPASLPSGLKTRDYMKICFAMIDVADAVFFLPDYENSDGAMVELAYCMYINKPIFFIKENTK